MENKHVATQQLSIWVKRGKQVGLRPKMNSDDVEKGEVMKNKNQKKKHDFLRGRDICYIQQTIRKNILSKRSRLVCC